MNSTAIGRFVGVTSATCTIGGGAGACAGLEHPKKQRAAVAGPTFHKAVTAPQPRVLMGWLFVWVILLIEFMLVEFGPLEKKHQPGVTWPFLTGLTDVTHRLSV